jgi:hypothetical protein
MLAGGDRERMREEWISRLVEDVLHQAWGVGDALVDALTSRTLAAFAYVHIARDHMLGRTAHDTAIRLGRWASGPWASLVPAAISRLREAGLGGALEDHVDTTWATLFLLARDDPLTPSQIAHVCEEDEQELERLFGAMWGWRRAALPNGDGEDWRIAPLHPGLVERLPTPHLAGLRPDEVGSQLLPLELIHMLPDDADLAAADTALAAARTIVDHWLIQPGGWPDLLPGERETVPDWLVEQVVTGGARFMRHTTGSLHTWTVVAEEGADEPAIRRLLRAAEQIGFEYEEDEVLLWLFAPRHAGDDDPGRIPFHYQLRWPGSINALLAIAMTGMVRLEVLAVEAGRIGFVGATGVPVPIELCERLRSIALAEYRERWGGDPEAFRAALVDERLIDQAEPRFRGSENARYELLWELSPLRPRGDWDLSELAGLESSRTRLLRLLSDRARGAAHDAGLLLSAREEFDLALSRSRPFSGGRYPRVADALPPGAGFLHLDRRAGHLDLTLAVPGAGGDEFRHLRCGVDTAMEDAVNVFLTERHRTRRDAAAWIAVVDRLLDRINEAFARADIEDFVAPARDIVMSAGASIDGVPFHLAESLSRLRSATYAPSLRFLAAVPGREHARSCEPVAILAYAGDGVQRLKAVDAEGRIVAALHAASKPRISAAAADLKAWDLAGTLHIAGHGVADKQLWARGLQLGPSGGAGFVSAADLLLKGLYGVELVYLSACSTSVADHRDTVVQSFGGVDYAALAAGARTCVASCWDVWDAPAALFAAALHFGLCMGDDLIGAYHTAQNALRTDLDSLDERLRSVLDQHWPGWLEAWASTPGRARPANWGAFRVSGAWW